MIPHQVCVRRVHFAHVGVSVRLRANIGVPLSSQFSVGIRNLFSASVVRNTEDAGGSTIVIHNERVVETLERISEPCSSVVQSVHVTTFVMLFPERDLLEDGLLSDLRIPKVPHYPAFGTLQLDGSGPSRILSSKYGHYLRSPSSLFIPLNIRCSCAASVSPVDDYFS